MRSDGAIMQDIRTEKSTCSLPKMISSSPKRPVTEFSRNSLKQLERAILKLIQPIHRNDQVGIFGTIQTAILIQQILYKQGRKNCFFISSDKPTGRFHKHNLFNIQEPHIKAADLIITSSLSRSDEQCKCLFDLGYSGRILSLPNLCHISTNPFRDDSTVEKIRQLKDRHLKQPAFIIGNGPSLAQTDPRLIPATFVRMAANGIIRLQDFIPDYYFSLDYRAIEMWEKEIAALSCQKIFAEHLSQHLLATHSNIISDKNIFFPVCYQQQQVFDITQWETKGFETSGTVVCPMLQFALWMGCNPIYIIGVDLSYQTDKTNYFCNNYHPEGIPNYTRREVNEFSQKLSLGISRSVAACRNAEVDIFNCAPTKNVQDLQYRDFSKILNLARENCHD